MATATELEKLVVKLVADASGYTGVFAKAEKDTKSLVDKIEKMVGHALKAQTDMMQEAARVTKAMATPMETYKNEVKQLDKLLAAGLISQQTYNRAFEKAEQLLPNVAAAQEKQNKMLAQANAITAQVVTAEEKHRSKLAELNQLLKVNYITQDTYNRAVAQAAAELPRATQAREALNSRLARAKQITDELRSPQEKQRQQMAELNAMYRRGLISVDTYNAGVKKLTTQVSTLVPNLQKAVSGLRGVQGAMNNAGTKLTMGVTAPAVAGAAFSLNEFGKYEAAMSGLNASVKPTVEQLARMDAEAMKLSEDLKMDPTLVLEVFTELLKAGMPLEKVLGGAGKAAAQFAKVGQLEVATAAVIMADSQTVFGEAAARTADILSSAADASSTSIPKIAEAFGQVSAVASLANQDLKDTATAIAILANNGVKGSDAGTSLKTMFTHLMAPTEMASNVIRQYNLELRDAEGNMKKLPELAQELQDKLGGLNAEARDNALYDLLGSDAIRGGAIFMKAGAEGFASMAKNMDEANTVADKYAIIMDNLFGKMQGVWATVKRVAIVMGATLAPTIERLLGWVNSLIETFGTWIEQNPGMAQVVAMLVAAAAAVGPILVGLAGMVGVVASVISGFVFLASVGWEIVAIAAAVAAGVAIMTTEFVIVGAAILGLIAYIVGPEGLTYAWETATSYAKSFVLNTLGFIANFQHNMQALMEWLPANWHLVLLDMGNLVMTIFVNMTKNVMIALGTQNRLFVAFFGWIGGMFERVFSAEFIGYVIEGVKRAVVIFQGFAAQAWKHLQAIFTGKKVDMSDFLDQLSKDMNAGADNINFAETAANIIREDFQKMHNPLEGFESTIGKNGPDFMFKMGKDSAEAFKAGSEAVAEVNPPEVKAAADATEEMTKEQLKARAKMYQAMDDETRKWEASEAKAKERMFKDMDKETAAWEKQQNAANKHAAAVKKVHTEVEKVVGLGGIQAAEAGSAEAISRAADYFALRARVNAGPDANLPGGVGLEPKMVKGKVKFDEGDIKAVAAVEKFQDKEKSDMLIDRMDDMVAELKISNELADDDTKFVVLEPANLGE